MARRRPATEQQPPISWPAAVLLGLALLLASLSIQWFMAERTLVRVGEVLDARSGQLSMLEWEQLEAELEHSLSLRPANTRALALKNRLWDEQRLVKNVLAGDENPLEAWFALQEQVGSEGLKALREATRLHPASPRAWTSLALRKLQLGQADDELHHALAQLLRYGAGNDEARRNLTLMTSTYTVDFIVEEQLLTLMLEHYYAVLAPGQYSVAEHMRLVNNSRNARLLCGFLDQERLADAARRVCTRALR